MVSVRFSGIWDRRLQVCRNLNSLELSFLGYINVLCTWLQCGRPVHYRVTTCTAVIVPRCIGLLMTECKVGTFMRDTHPVIVSATTGVVHMLINDDGTLQK